MLQLGIHFLCPLFLLESDTSVCMQGATRGGDPSPKSRLRRRRSPRCSKISIRKTLSANVSRYFRKQNGWLQLAVTLVRTNEQATFAVVL
jgi:hypothetical protein